MEGLDDSRLILLLLPLVLLELGGKIFALVALARTPREDVRTESRALWAVVILLVNVLGWILWFLVGRKRS